MVQRQVCAIRKPLGLDRTLPREPSGVTWLGLRAGPDGPWRQWAGRVGVFPVSFDKESEAMKAKKKAKGKKLKKGAKIEATKTLRGLGRNYLNPQPLPP